MQTVGEKLWLWLHSRGLKQQDFAEKAGLSAAYISQLVSGLRHAGLSSALKIERATKGEIPARLWVRPDPNKPAKSAQR